VRRVLTVPIPTAVLIGRRHTAMHCTGVFSRVLGGDPEGLGVASPWSRVIGLLLTFYGVVVLIGIIERVIQQQIDENLASGPSLVRAFNEQHAQRAELEKAKSRSDQQPKKRWRLGERSRARRGQKRKQDIQPR
jgi:hypothetical protein